MVPCVTAHCILHIIEVESSYLSLRWHTLNETDTRHTWQRRARKLGPAKTKLVDTPCLLLSVKSVKCRLRCWSILEFCTIPMFVGYPSDFPVHFSRCIFVRSPVVWWVMFLFWEGLNVWPLKPPTFCWLISQCLLRHGRVNSWCPYFLWWVPSGKLT